MRLHCYHCNESISSEVPDGTVLRAMALCPECTGAGDKWALNWFLRSLTPRYRRHRRVAGGNDAPVPKLKWRRRRCPTIE